MELILSICLHLKTTLVFKKIMNKYAQYAQLFFMTYGGFLKFFAKISLVFVYMHS